MKVFFFSLLLITPFFSNAQKQGNTWYFGTGAGIDFSTGIPVAIFNGKTGSDVPTGSNQEGTAVISDSSGKLLLYTSGRTIWNRNHQPMPNGTDIMGGASATQSSIIVPKPGSDSLFFVFTTDEFQSYLSFTSKGYRYSVVDMCRDSTRGDVLLNQKNILLLDSATEKLAVCEDATDDGYWVVGHELFSRKFYAWHLTAAGLSSPVISDIGTFHGRSDFDHSYRNPASALGQLKINAQGTKIALAIGNYNPAVVDLFDFNKNTGTVSNFCHIAIDSVLQKRSYGVEFSPDGSKLYAGVSGGSGGKRLYQYDLTGGGGDCSAIMSSQIKLFQSNSAFQVVGMQLGPDNKIYVICNTPFDVGMINSPDLLGTACNFDSSVVALSPASSYYALPAFIAGYKYHNGISCKTVSPPVNIDSSCTLDVKSRPYPNPFNSLLIVDKKPTRCKVTMRIYNVIGQLIVKDKVINDGRNEIQTGKIAAGIYFYQLASGNTILLTGNMLKL